MWKEASFWFVGHNNVLQNTSLAQGTCASACRCLLCLVWPSKGASLACEERQAQPLASPSSCFRQCCSRAVIFQPVAMRTRGAHGPEQQHSTKRNHTEDTNSPVLAQQTEHEARLQLSEKAMFRRTPCQGKKYVDLMQQTQLRKNCLR